MSQAKHSRNQPTTSRQEMTWKKKARAVSRKVNFGWWLQSFSIPVTIVSLFIAAGILTARYYERLPSYTIATLTIVAIISLCGFVCWLISKKKFETTEESLVRLEDSLKLENSLSAAKAGILPWPSEPDEHPEAKPNLAWHLPRTLLPTVLSLIFIGASFFIPIGSHAQLLASQPAPDALTELETKLEQLKDEDIVQEDYIEEIEEKVEEIKEQDPADWFSHSSLEAIDNLNENHEAAANDLSQNLNNAERALQSLQKHGDKMSETNKQNLLNEFGKAVENLDTGNMKPNKELLDQLKKIDPKQLNQLTPEQLDQLRQNMRKMAEKLKKQQGQNEP